MGLEARYAHISGSMPFERAVARRADMTNQAVLWV